MDEPSSTCNQENNQLLLNAIRNKFAAQDASEATSFCPPKFNIPHLKSAKDVADSTASPLKFSPATSTMSNLNEFILSQLQEKSTIAGTGKGFILPKLNIGNLNGSAERRCVLPTQKKDSTIALVTNGVYHMSVNDSKEESSKIDLTAALSNNYLFHASGSVSSKNKIAIQDFDIPFIACDIKEKLKVEQYCQPDVSHLKLQHCLVAPSCFARITCLKYKRTRNLPYIDHSFKAKHKIQHFRFDTKSPDDIILAKFARFKR